MLSDQQLYHQWKPSIGNTAVNLVIFLLEFKTLDPQRYIQITKNEGVNVLARHDLGNATLRSYQVPGDRPDHVRVNKLLGVLSWYIYWRPLLYRPTSSDRYSGFPPLFLHYFIKYYNQIITFFKKFNVCMIAANLVHGYGNGNVVLGEIFITGCSGSCQNDENFVEVTSTFPFLNGGDIS